jgi:EAL domain-containing protein (putative c-di-GMP-specific phosphodiesterase class I)
MRTFGNTSDGRRDDAETGDHGSGRLYLWFPVGLAMQTVRRHLRQAGRTFEITASGAFAVDAPEGNPRELILALADVLTDHEGADTRCVFKLGRGDLDVDDIRRVRTIHELRSAASSSWFVDLLRAERLTSVFQPIVLASETSQVLGHEALMRGIGEDGATMMAGALMNAARGCGMLSELECAARRSAIRAAASQEERRPLFLNFTADAMRHGARSLGPTIRAIEEAEIPRERVVFEVIEAEQAADLRQLRGVVDSVRGEGFRVSLDDIGVADYSRRLIHEVRPDYMKLDMERVRASSQPQMAQAERLLDLAQTLKIETIAEGVETGEELEWNRARGATYVQGYYIARPGELRVPALV